MATIIDLPTGSVSRPVQLALKQFYDNLDDAILKAKQANVPQGLIIGVLHVYTHAETQELLK